MKQNPDLMQSSRPMAGATVLSVHASARHSFSKPSKDSIRLLEGLGVEGDAHCGRLVKHRHDARKDPLRPNRRQVHLLQAELFDEVNARGFSVASGDLGENITTQGIDLLGLPRDTRLHIGAEAVVEITGLRDPCVYIDRFQKGLLAAVVERRPGREIVRKTGVMSIVIRWWARWVGRHHRYRTAGDPLGVVARLIISSSKRSPHAPEDRIARRYR